MPKKQTRNYSIKYHFTKNDSDLKKIMDMYFLKYYQALKNAQQTENRQDTN